MGMQRVSQQKLGARKARREIRAAFSPHKSEPSGVGWVLKRALRRENDAGTGTSDGIPYETRPPEKKWRRSLGYRGGHVRKFPFGEKMAPEPGFPTGSRTGSALRRRNDAAAWVLDGIPYEKRPPAPDSRRKPDCLRHSCGNAPSGAEMTPKGAFATDALPAETCARAPYEGVHRTKARAVPVKKCLLLRCRTWALGHA